MQLILTTAFLAFDYTDAMSGLFGGLQHPMRFKAERKTTTTQLLIHSNLTPSLLEPKIFSHAYADHAALGFTPPPVRFQASIHACAAAAFAFLQLSIHACAAAAFTFAAMPFQVVVAQVEIESNF